VGQRSREHYRRLGCPEHKLVFSPHAIDSACFAVDASSAARLRGEHRALLGAGEQHHLILFSGKLSRRKGPDLLLQAVKALEESVRRRVMVIWMGDGALRGELEAKTGAHPAVESRFLGFRNQSALSGIYHASDLLVLPSRELETWGLVVNEALHHGLPVAVSDAAGCAPDLVEEGRTGFSFPAGSVPGLRQAIERGLALRGAETARACQARASEYTIEKAAAGIARAYHDALRAQVAA
jgi:glycosyltransferase involved in cell wall biosynthesis